MTNRPEKLRVALMAGSLFQGGAEKQLVYIVRALLEQSVDVRVYCLTRDEYYEPALAQLGVPPIWIGQNPNPFVRALALARHVRRFKPHILQTLDFFANLHVTIAGRLTGTLAVGAIRIDTEHEVELMGRWGPWLLRMPTALVANSYAGRDNAIARTSSTRSIHVLANALDLEAFDDAGASPLTDWDDDQRPIAMTVCRLVRAKRIDRFLKALSIAREHNDRLCGVVVGDGPEQPALEATACDLGLSPQHVRFVGRRNDVPALIKKASMLVISSDHEGTPNVALEAMASRRPVVTTPAGDAAHVVVDQKTGFVVPYEDTQAMADRMVQLVESPTKCREFGDAGRSRVENLYGYDTLADRVFALYRDIAERHKNRELIDVLSQSMNAPRQAERIGETVSHLAEPAQGPAC